MTSDRNKSLLQKSAGWVKHTFKWVFFILLAYGVVILVGLVPVNNDFEPTTNGVQLFVVSNAVHADIILPKSNRTVDWAATFGDANFLGDISLESHVAFGWGDRGFFLETQTWDDLKLSTVANALLLPSDSCVHVSFVRPEYYRNATPVTVSQQQYEQLVEFINGTFKMDVDGKHNQINGYAYSSTDAFFDACGRYHLLNTCNSWAGRALKQAGVRVPWFSPMPKTPMLYIEKEVAFE